MNQHKYGSKAQKRKPDKSAKDDTDTVDHSRNKDDFDGTPGSIGMGSTSAAAGGEDTGGMRPVPFLLILLSTSMCLTPLF